MKIRVNGIYNGVPGWKYSALLNGEAVPCCLEADDIEGYVIVKNHEPGDRPGLVRILDGSTRIKGVVTIVPPVEPTL